MLFKKFFEEFIIPKIWDYISEISTALHRVQKKVKRL